MIWDDQPKKKISEISEASLRSPAADKTFFNIRPSQTINPIDTLYRDSHAGFQSHPTQSDQATVSPQSLNIKQEINYMIDKFMCELIDYNAFNNLDPDTQTEIISRYPQFFE